LLYEKEGIMADSNELREVMEQVLATYNAGDLDGYSALWHDEVGIFGIISPFPALGKAAVRQYFHNVFSNAESQTFTVINPHYRVIDNTGVVWSHYALALKPKDGPMQAMFGRSTFTFVKTEGRWLMVDLHVSPVSVGS
jgi:uncharacterized protein (TIGR02246 family)